MTRRRLAVRVTPDALRQIRGGHPWVYADAITSISADGRPGDLAVVFDQRRRFAAIGLYDPTSPIRVKVLHHGAPETIDAEWWRSRVATASDRRVSLRDDPTTTAWRVVHGENDGLPGLVVDRYEDTAVVKLYSTALITHLDDVLAAVDDALAPTRVVLRASRLVAPHLPTDRPEGTTVRGSPPAGPVAYREHGLRFTADVVQGQKTGTFLDQRENRRLVAWHSRGARVLDVFCSTGGFGVHAAAGGARAVHFVDQSPGAIATARDNLDANRDRAPATAVTDTIGDAFDVLTALGAGRRRFDIVVIDPPSFAPHQGAVAAARRAYRHLTALALPLVAPGGLLFQASCSSRVAAADFLGGVRIEAQRARVEWTELAVTGHPLDHPIGFPQGAYLKAVLARVGPRNARR